MNFALTEEQEAIRDLARQIFSDRASHQRLLELEKSGEWFDTALWSELATANLTSLAIPDSLGGGGFGMLELCLVLEELGRHVAPVPLFPTAVLAALPIAAFGTPEQQQRWLRPVVEEEAVLSAALVEYGSSQPARPRVTARRDGDRWRIDGEKECVPAAHLAAAILVPASTPEGVAMFLVDPNGSGVSRSEQITSHREPQWRLELSGAAALEILGQPGEGDAIVAFLAERTALGLAAIQLGVADGALRQTASYVSERKQFGRPIATFQAVALRAADAYIDVQAMRGTVAQAAWRLGTGRPATAEVAVAKWWAATAGQRVVHTAQHLHGGIGSDIEYPIHRFFLWSKQNELLLGGANQQLAQLGAYLVSDAFTRVEA